MFQDFSTFRYTEDLLQPYPHIDAAALSVWLAARVAAERPELGEHFPCEVFWDERGALNVLLPAFDGNEIIFWEVLDAS